LASGLLVGIAGGLIAVLLLACVLVLLYRKRSHQVAAAERGEEVSSARRGRGCHKGVWGANRPASSNSLDDVIDSGEGMDVDLDSVVVPDKKKTSDKMEDRQNRRVGGDVEDNVESDSDVTSKDHRWTTTVDTPNSSVGRLASSDVFVDSSSAQEASGGAPSPTTGKKMNPPPRKPKGNRRHVTSAHDDQENGSNISGSSPGRVVLPPLVRTPKAPVVRLPPSDQGEAAAAAAVGAAALAVELETELGDAPDKDDDDVEAGGHRGPSSSKAVKPSVNMAHHAAALKGDPKAMLKLGAHYEEHDNSKQGFEEAAKWYRKAAEQGLVEAQCRLGNLCEQGLDGSSDEEAVEWYRKASEQGYAIAQCNLAVMLDHGRGTKQNSKEAVKWYRKAADQGLADAQGYLAICYGEGDGVGKSAVEARKWYTKAADQGHVDSQVRVCAWVWFGCDLGFAVMDASLVCVIYLLLHHEGLSKRGRPIPSCVCVC
jgi:TPR repeat protein